MVATSLTVTLTRSRAEKLGRLAKRAGVSVEEYLDRALAAYLADAEEIAAAVAVARVAARDGRHRTIDDAERELQRRRKNRAR